MSEHPSTQDSSESGGLRTRVLDGSRVATVLRAPFRDESRVRRGGRWLSGVVRHSFIYRWLTTEPDPDVIVIDLRETWTVGPVIHMLDRVVAWLMPAWTDSTLKRVLDTVVAHVERVANTRYGRRLGTLLEPPEPPRNPENEDTERSPSDERRR